MSFYTFPSITFNESASFNDNSNGLIGLKVLGLPFLV